MKEIITSLCNKVAQKLRELSQHPLERVYAYIVPIVKILEAHGYAEFAAQLQAAPASSQSLVECFGQTRDVARVIAQQSFAKELNINHDLEFIAKYCQRSLHRR